MGKLILHQKKTVFQGERANEKKKIKKKFIF
jgi:hypothetical protein